MSLKPDIKVQRKVTRELSAFVKKYGEWSKVARAMEISRVHIYRKKQTHDWSFEDIKFFVKERLIDEIVF